MVVKIGPVSPDEMAILLDDPPNPSPNVTQTGPISPGRMAELLADIKTKLDDLETKVAALETAVAALETDVTTLQAQIVTIQAQIATLITDVTTLQAQVTTLIADVTTLQTDVTTLQAQVVTLNVNVTTLQAQVVILEITVAGLVLQTFGHVISSQRVLTGFDLSGLTYGQNNLFYVDNVTRTVYEIDPNTFALVNSFATLGNNPAGLAYEDANSIWYGDRVDHIVREVNPNSGVWISEFNVGFDVSAIAFDGTHLWIGNEDNNLIYMYTTAGVLVRTISAFASVTAFGLTYVAPYLYVMGIYVEGVLIEMETGATPSTPIIKYHAIKRGYNNLHGLAYDGSHLRLGQGGDGVTNSFISRIFRT